MEVIDAKYRGTDAIISKSSGLSAQVNYTNSSGNGYICGTKVLNTDSIPNGTTCAKLCTLWKIYYNEDTAKNLTIKNFSREYSGSKKVTNSYGSSFYYPDTANGNWYIPNAFQGAVIFCLSDVIDSLDPTINDYSLLMLGKNNPGKSTKYKGRISFGVSSNFGKVTEYDTITERDVLSQATGVIKGNTGDFDVLSSYSASTINVVAIREL